MSEWTTRFKRIAAEDRRDLPLMPKPCHDCAVVCGLYSEISEALKEEPGDLQLAVSRKWFCHNSRRMACRGNADLLGIHWGMP